MFHSKSFSRKKLQKMTAALLSTLFLFVFSASLSAAAANKTVVISPEMLNAASSAPAASDNPILDYSLDINAESAIVVEVGRGMKLYLKNPELRMDIAAACKIMTAVIAIEALPLDTRVTISKVAADEPDSAALSLVNGEKYSLEYLLYGLLMTDNNAAAIAIAEQVSGEEGDFIKLMNDKALSYKMENTIFANVTGKLDSSQYTTVGDVSRLVRYALTFPKFEAIMKTKDIPFFLSTDRTKHLFSNIENAWLLVDTTTGAIKCKSETDSTFVATATSGGISIIIVGSTIKDSDVVHDISIISNAIFKDYEYSTLVMENQQFPQTIQVGSDIIPLRFNQEITYVHPKDVGFIRSTTYEENENIEYPVLTTKSVAKVVFELLDDTKITADLYPAVTIWDESNYLQKIILIYNANPDIGNIILIAAGILILLVLYSLIRLIIRMNRAIYMDIKLRRELTENRARLDEKENDQDNGSAGDKK